MLSGVYGRFSLPMGLFTYPVIDCAMLEMFLKAFRLSAQFEYQGIEFLFNALI